MNTRRYFIPLCLTSVFIILAVVTGCKNDTNTDSWVETNDVAIIAYKSNPENGKQYLNIIYENVGHETYSKIKYQLFIHTGAKVDTVEKVIIPTTVFLPKNKRLVPRNIGEEPATWDDVKVGKIWVVKDAK